MSAPAISALVVAHNEEHQIAACLDGLAFADEIVVVLDRCTDGTRALASARGAKLVEGAWPIEGDRRNAGIAACQGPWIFEVDADERVPAALADELRRAAASGVGDVFNLPIHNYVGGRWIRHGWGGLFGTNGKPAFFRKGTKTWGRQRIHPHLDISGRQGPALATGIIHHIDRDFSDMVRRFDRYTTARAADLRESREFRPFPTLARKCFSRFLKSYLTRRGYREGGIGILIALFAALYPLVSQMKAQFDDDASSPNA